MASLVAELGTGVRYSYVFVHGLWSIIIYWCQMIGKQTEDEGYILIKER